MCWYLSQDSDQKRIYNFLSSVDGEFHPPLHCRVDLENYATKLASSAVNFFLVSENQDIAHAAFYCNDFENKAAFISSISVCGKFHGSGAAQFLLKEVMKKCAETGMVTIKLEVDARNLKAVRFYQKQGFDSLSDCLMEACVESN